MKLQPLCAAHGCFHAYQQIFIYFQVPIIMRQICSPVQRREALFICLIDLSSIVEKVVHLKRKTQVLQSDPPNNTETNYASSSTHHIELSVGGREMDWCTSSVILGYKIRVRLHDFCKLLWIAQPDGTVKGNWAVKGVWWISAGACASTNVTCRCPLLVPTRNPAPLENCQQCL